MLKSGSPENAIKLAEEQLEKNKVAIQNKGVYIFAWVLSLAISVFLYLGFANIHLLISLKR